MSAGAIFTPGYDNAQSGKAPCTLQAEQVAHQALMALGNGPITTPGFTNKLAYFFMENYFLKNGLYTS